MEDSLVRVLVFDKQGVLDGSFGGKCDGRRGGLNETARSGVPDG